MTQLTHRIRSATLLLAAAVMIPLIADGQTMGRPEKYRANAVNLEAGRQGPIEINVERWSTDAERDKLMAALCSTRTPITCWRY